METTTLTSKIEAVLFYAGEPVQKKVLSKICEATDEELVNALKLLKEELLGRGVALVESEDAVLLATNPQLAPLIEKMVKEERERDIGRAGVETLAIIAYKGPVSKKEIEYIRGVNSQFALRSLLLRGLVERKNSERDERVALYTLTSNALLHLGISKVSELPEYTVLKKELQAPEEELEQTKEE